MTTSPIRLRGLEELISTLPLQLGYRPEDSLVLLLLGPPEPTPDSTTLSGAVRLTCRLDLPHDVGGYEESLALISQLIQRQRPAMVNLIAFEDQVDATKVLRAMAQVCVIEDVAVQHLARVRDGRWCQLEGSSGESVWRAVPDVDRVPAAADLVLAGANVGPGRSELAQLIRVGLVERKVELLEELEDYLDRFLEAVPEARHPDDLVGRREQMRLRFIERGALAWRRVLDVTPGGPEVGDLPAAVLAQGLLMLLHREFRDGLITWVAPGAMGPGLLNGETACALVRHLPIARVRNKLALDRLIALCALVPDDYAAPLLTVTGQAAWALNNGTVANLAVGRALELDPDYYLAQLTDQLLQNAVPPPKGPFATAA